MTRKGLKALNSILDTQMGLRPNERLSRENKSWTKWGVYTSAVGSLMYAMVCTRPNLAQGVSVVSKFLANPGKQYWSAVKGIFIYLRGTTNYGIMFDRQQDELSVRGYVDADYVGI